MVPMSFPVMTIPGTTALVLDSPHSGVAYPEDFRHACDPQALRRAETLLREDKDTVAKLDQIQTLARKVDQVVSTGQMPDQATAEAYEGAVRDLEMSPTGQAYVVARSNFENLMQKVNQQISEGMEKGATSSIITLG